MTYPPPPSGYPGGQPQDPYGQQHDPYGQQPGAYGQPQQPDPYGQQQFPPPNDPYAPQHDPYAPQAPTSGPAADGGWGSPPQSAPGGGYNPTSPMSGPPGAMGGPPGQPPMGPPGQPPMFGMPQPAPKKSNAGLIVGVIIGVVALVGLATVLVFTLGGDDDEQPTTQQSTDEPTEEPTDEPTEEPTDDPAGSVSYIDFAEAWSGSHDGESLSADYYNGWDYSTCSDVSRGSTLDTEGCEYAAEIVHEAEGGDLRIGQLVLAFGESSGVSGLADELNNADFESDYAFQTDSFLSAYEGGVWIADPAGSFVVITIVTYADASDEDLAEAYLYGKADDTISDLQAR